VSKVYDLPCSHWCEMCQDIADDLARNPGCFGRPVPGPCEVCHDCNLSLSAAEDATW
jgi:hypothetical protein